MRAGFKSTYLTFDENMFNGSDFRMACYYMIWHGGRMTACQLHHASVWTTQKSGSGVQHIGANFINTFSNKLQS